MQCVEKEMSDVRIEKRGDNLQHQVTKDGGEEFVWYETSKRANVVPSLYNDPRSKIVTQILEMWPN